MYKKIYNGMRFVALFVMSVAVLMSVGASYTAFSNGLCNKTADECVIISELIQSADDPAEILKNIDFSETDTCVVLRDETGVVLFDNSGTHGGKMMYCCVSELDDGISLTVGMRADAILRIFLRLLPVIVFSIVLMLIFIWRISRIITENIMKPVQNIYSLDPEKREDIYEELKPFIQRISGQTREIERQMGKVRMHKLRLNTITENMSEGLVVVDENACVLSVNQSAKMLFELEDRDVKYKEFRYISEDSELLKGIISALNGDKSHITKEIGEKTYRVYFSPAIEGGFVSGAVLLMLDVSEMVRAEQIRKEFSANVSHELKTPVTTIHGYAQIIKHGMAKPEMFDEFIGKIEKESNRLIALIEDIIKISNLDEKEENYEKHEISLMTVAENVKELLADSADKRGITIKISGEDSVVTANEGGVHEVIYNLCDNAIKYNVDGGIVEMETGERKITVRDTGIGIPEEYTDRIFERFFRVDKSHSKKVNGTGLGLSIVKHIAKKNNCDIDVVSRPGEGSEFTVFFKK